MMFIHTYIVGGNKKMFMKCNNARIVIQRLLNLEMLLTAGFVRRRRECPKCNYRFTTYERIERPQLIVLKKMDQEKCLIETNCWLVLIELAKKLRNKYPNRIANR